jgi:hypothetical protein
MTRRLVVLALMAGGLLLTAAVVYAISAPGVFPSDECHVKIVEITFETAIETADGAMEEPNPDEYRLAVVTFRIEKPADRDIALHAADLTLHYEREGGEYDVAPCEALASFTTAKDEDRSLQMPGVGGPGWVKVKTGAGARKATTIYSEAVFGKIEPDAHQFWLAIARPATAAFTSEGWEP